MSGECHPGPLLLCRMNISSHCEFKQSLELLWMLWQEILTGIKAWSSSSWPPTYWAALLACVL